jgi:hypothetical protein
VTIVLTPKYLTRFIALGTVESLLQKKRLRKDIYKPEEISGMEKKESAKPAKQFYPYTTTMCFVNRVL